jgi:hypothetical protein
VGAGFVVPFDEFMEEGYLEELREGLFEPDFAERAERGVFN